MALYFFLSMSGDLAAATDSRAMLKFNLLEKLENPEKVVESVQEFSDLDNLKLLQIKSINRLKNNVQPARYPVLCESCHSKVQINGNSYLPILQGQNQEYLFSKILMFKNNARSFHPYPGFLQALTLNEMMEISLFYANQSSNLKYAVRASAFLIKSDSSNSLNLNLCVECHGVDGNGSAMIPSISGQNENYLGFRIREISGQGSRIHVSHDAPVNCQIPDVNIRQSKQLARQLSTNLDK